MKKFSLLLAMVACTSMHLFSAESAEVEQLIKAKLAAERTHAEEAGLREKGRPQTPEGWSEEIFVKLRGEEERTWWAVAHELEEQALERQTEIFTDDHSDGTDNEAYHERCLDPKKVGELCRFYAAIPYAYRMQIYEKSKKTEKGDPMVALALQWREKNYEHLKEIENGNWDLACFERASNGKMRLMSHERYKPEEEHV